jgi:hypothetical protein
MAAKSHRREHGNPQLTISMLPTHVEWRLTDLDHGIPETVAGQPRKDRVDFYFEYSVFKATFPNFPAPRTASVPSQHRFAPTNSQGTERRGGKDVRVVAPICRFSPLSDAELISHTPPAFRATTGEAILHLDMESGPARIYGVEIFEVHFGIEAPQWDVAPLSNPATSYAVIRMSDSLYATVYSELGGL